MVEVPVEQETVNFEDIGLTLILPGTWKDQYATETMNLLSISSMPREFVRRVEAKLAVCCFTSCGGTNSLPRSR